MNLGNKSFQYHRSVWSNLETGTSTSEICVICVIPRLRDLRRDRYCVVARRRMFPETIGVLLRIFNLAIVGSKTQRRELVTSAPLFVSNGLPNFRRMAYLLLWPEVHLLTWG